jgi:Flp pilus assembly protein TadG
MIRGQTGQTLVEFTFIFLLFLMLLFGIAEGGRLIFNYGIVSQAAREGVRYASVRGSTCKIPGGSSCTATTTDIKNYVVGKAIGLLIPANVTVSWPGGSNTPGKIIAIQTSYAFQPLVWFMPSVTLSSQSQMVIVR